MKLNAKIKTGMDVYAPVCEAINDAISTMNESKDFATPEYTAQQVRRLFDLWDVLTACIRSGLIVFDNVLPATPDDTEPAV